jgi:hypothetical protein
MHAVARLAPALAGLAMATLVQAQGADELWNMTTRMEMAGMQMPGSTQQVCMKKGETRADSVAPDKDCKVTDFRTAGNKTTWKIVCTGQDAMSGSGEMTRTPDSLSGRAQMKDKDGDEMTIVYSGKLVGKCNAQEPSKLMAAAQAQSNAAMAQACREGMERYQTPLFEGPQAACKAQKGEFCGRVTKVTQSMRTPAGYRKAMSQDGLRGDDWELAAKACGVQAAEVRGAACKSGVGGRDWPFVAEYCPAESQKVAAEHCAGREYTVAMSSEYKAICAKQAGGFAQPQRAAAKPAAAPADAVQQGVKEGARALKKLFGN